MGKRRLGESRNNNSRDTVMVNTIRTDTNPPLTSALSSDHKIPTMSKLERKGAQLVRYIYILSQW